ncbi:MAG: hypothetical protein ACON38_08165 [Akkermansiaceae bacterium]
MEKSNGSILWNNPLESLGYGYCLIANNHQNNVSIIAQTESEQAAAASGGASGAG